MKYATLLGLAIVLTSITAARATTDGCAVVLNTPDGFLALREGPGTQFRIKDKLRPRQIVSIPTEDCNVICNKWIKVLGTSGWVRGKYIQPIGESCSLDETQPEFERKYIGTWCRVSSDPDGRTLRREPRGKTCSSERRVVITATAVHGMFAPVDVRGTSQGLTEDEAKSVGKFEMMHCKVEQYSVNMNGWAWVWFACSNGEYLRGVFLIDGRELVTSREMLREKHSD